MFPQPPKQNKNPQPAGPQNSGPAPLSSRYDTATQTFRKGGSTKGSNPKAKASGGNNKKGGGGGGAGSKGGFAGKSSMVRPLSPQEHMQAADHLASGGFHHASAHHRSAAESMSGGDEGEAEAGE